MEIARPAERLARSQPSPSDVMDLLRDGRLPSRRRSVTGIDESGGSESMLIDMMTGARISKMPFAAEYNRYISAMTGSEIAAIKAHLNSMIDGTEIQTAGWMPGSDWTGTVFEPIYFKAANQSYEASAKCFGLMVWEVFMERPEVWTSGRFEKDGEPIGSRTYFQPA